jgi:hypothetical protein
MKVTRTFTIATLTAALVVSGLVAFHAGRSDGATPKATPKPGFTVSRASVTLLQPSSNRVILRVAQVGVLHARCAPDGHATTMMHVSPQALDALTVVQTTGRGVRNTLGPQLLAPTPPRGTGIQVWQIGSISSANPPSGPVATITVALAHYPPSRGCVVSARSSSTLPG